ncbi:MAG: hypothetical protein JW938_04280 [Candidatus Omnitrophica bacterium]|nr:hypothetical protein [Candidatus Omnitrophota bacterium]
MKRRRIKIITYLIAFIYVIALADCAAVDTIEIIDTSTTRVAVRIHPKTGNEYIAIYALDHEKPLYDFQVSGEKYSRPDYQMLSHTTRSGDIPYDGPVSDRTKIYVLAATLAASGIAAGAVAQATAAAAATTTASTGAAGAYATAGAVLGGVSIATPLIKARPDPHRNDFIHESKVTVLE